MNRAKLKDFQRQALTPKTSELEGAFSAPTANGGTRFALPEVKTQVVQAKLLAGDPNANGGLDANGYQVALLVTYDYGFRGASTWPQVRLDVSGLPAGAPTFDDGTFVYAFMFGYTPDGFLLLQPTLSGNTPNLLLAKWTGATIWNPGTNSTNAVEIYAGAAPETDQFRTVTARNRFHTLMPGDFCLIERNRDAWYVVSAFTDVLFGQNQNTNINQGSTGSIHVFDDAFNDSGLTVTARALHDLVRNDYVQLFWERVNTSHNYEWYAIPLSRPCIGKPASDIAQGTSGSVALYDSKGNSMTVSRTVWASFSKLISGQWCLAWWDYKQQQFYGVPLTYGAVATDCNFHTTGTLSHGDATATATVDTYFNGDAPTGTVTINNGMHHSLPNGGHGWAYLVIYDPATGNATYEIRSVRPVDWNGYAAGSVQFLMHDTSGNMEWVTGAACP